MSIARRMIMLLSDISGAWDAHFEFATDVAAPLTSPYTEGAHSLTLVQVDGQLSISGGALQIPQQATPAFGDLGYYSESWARVTGRAVLYQINRTGGAGNKEIIFGWGSAANVQATAVRHGIYMAGVNIFNWVNGGASATLLSASFADSTSYQIYIWLRSSGYAAAIKGGVFSAWRLLTVVDSITTTPMYGVLTSTTATATEDYARFRVLPAPFDSDYGFATFTDTTLTSGDAFTGSADALKRFEFTLPGAPSAGDEIAMYYRGDATDGCKIVVKRNAGNTAWDFRFRKVEAGVESTPAGWTDVAGVGTPDLIEVYCEGSVHFFNTRAGAVFTKRGNTITLNWQNTNTAMSVVTASGTTLTRVTDFPLTGAVYSELDRL